MSSKSNKNVKNTKKVQSKKEKNDARIVSLCTTVYELHNFRMCKLNELLKLRRKQEI